MCVQNISSITIVGLDSANYPDYRAELIQLYALSFTEGEHAQHIPSKAIESSLDETMAVGFGFIAVQENKLGGVVLSLSLKNDTSFPFDKHKDIDPAKAIYIAELMVHHHFRGQGVAQRLLEQVFELSQAKHYNDAVIRVWDKNTPAVSLYKKLGFEEMDSIFQTKLSKETREPFEMRKIYMHKKL
ncbi:MAG TPA: GNAT family N-acetyltransferase [Dysgonamonadaceae bacterium]|nr:GNAT family N-acetyltransferase [Dysgonamonadaceae bacterium]